MPIVNSNKLKNIVRIHDYLYDEAYKMLRQETGISNFDHLIKITYSINDWLRDNDLIWLNDEWQWEIKPRDLTISNEDLEWLNELRDLYLTMKNDK